MAYVLNTGNVPIPNDKKLTPKESNELARLQQRKHLRNPMTIRNKDGLVSEIREPLTPEERVKLDEWELVVRDQNPPAVGHLSFPFAPYGQDGCLWDVPIGALTLVAQHPNRLKIVSRDEAAKLRVLPRYHSNTPTLSEYQFGHKEHEEETVPTAAEEQITHAALIKDGVVKESGSLGFVPGTRITKR